MNLIELTKRRLKKHQELIGQKFGKLTVLSISEIKKDGGFCYDCSCECDPSKLTVVRKGALVSGNTKSCGCGIKEHQQRHFTDFTGKKFGKWTVLGQSCGKYSHIIWDCVCDCDKNKIIKVSNSSLRRGLSKSCGYHTHKRGGDNPKWEGFGKIGLSWWNQIKKDAINRDLPFEVSIEYAWELFLKQDRKCALSGIDLKMPEYTKDVSRTASFDRINSNKNLGYIDGNCQWIHKELNNMKNIFTQEYFIQTCKEIVKYRKLNVQA